MEELTLREQIAIVRKSADEVRGTFTNNNPGYNEYLMGLMVGDLVEAVCLLALAVEGEKNG